MYILPKFIFFPLEVKNKTHMDSELQNVEEVSFAGDQYQT